MRIETVGPCWDLGCECPKYDGGETSRFGVPPFHDGCVCVAVVNQEEEDNATQENHRGKP